MPTAHSTRTVLPLVWKTFPWTTGWLGGTPYAKSPYLYAGLGGFLAILLIVFSRGYNDNTMAFAYVNAADVPRWR